ncbi:hypothetical protein BDP81DRAFT_118262 [Colletotrichum phormii]|uniref:Uncharacterized protein n=1 Tax=Colletotrichum phormii TaxID=359342 RepID=A0AAI9ZIC8_9PEZI|nr:uncharacterized protein BDP81DRAFT_118262 [Colletotrichum phormii]KAK1623859.1 hypothetical protein BDP81DRAFT_118262 [Colletotrichum phormii]
MGIERCKSSLASFQIRAERPSTSESAMACMAGSQVGNRFIKSSIRLRFSLHRITQTDNPPCPQSRLPWISAHVSKYYSQLAFRGNMREMPMPLAFLLSSQLKVSTTWHGTPVINHALSDKCHHPTLSFTQLGPSTVNGCRAILARNLEIGGRLFRTHTKGIPHPY